MPDESNHELLDPSKEIRLHLPLSTHLLLHELKIKHNVPIRDAVVAALDMFFRQHPLDPDASLSF